MYLRGAWSLSVTNLLRAFGYQGGVPPPAAPPILCQPSCRKLATFGTQIGRQQTRRHRRARGSDRRLIWQPPGRSPGPRSQRRRARSRRAYNRRATSVPIGRRESLDPYMVYDCALATAATARGRRLVFCRQRTIETRPRIRPRSAALHSTSGLTSLLGGSHVWMPRGSVANEKGRQIAHTSAPGTGGVVVEMLP